MKYFVLGALASGLLLYGMSMIYGATGTLDINGVAATRSSPASANRIDPRVRARVRRRPAIAFKLGAVPYHMWMPDVLRRRADADDAVHRRRAEARRVRLRDAAAGRLAVRRSAFDWQGMLLVLSLLSMILGNVVAIAQTNIKRMLAYSTIANMGFMLMGFLTARPATATARRCSTRSPTS